jgi:hypothetical protein
MANREERVTAESLADEAASFHEAGDCRCPKHRPTGRMAMGHSVCLVCGRLAREKAV